MWERALKSGKTRFLFSLCQLALCRLTWTSYCTSCGLAPLLVRMGILVFSHKVGMKVNIEIQALVLNLLQSSSAVTFPSSSKKEALWEQLEGERWWRQSMVKFFWDKWREEHWNIYIATAAAKSPQSCPTLCDPVPGILQARTLEWVAIFLFQCMEVKSDSEVAQSCLTLLDPMDCSLPGSSVHGIFQARVLEWGAIAFSV